MASSFDADRLELLVDTLERFCDSKMPELQRATIGQGEIYRGELVDPYGALPLLTVVAYDIYDTARIPEERLPFPFRIQAEPSGLMHMQVIPNQVDKASFALGALLLTDVLYDAASRVDLKTTNSIELDHYMPRLAVNVPLLWQRSEHDARLEQGAAEAADLSAEHRASGS